MPEMKNINISGVTYEIVDQKAREDIKNMQESSDGLTMAQVNALDGMFKKCAFTGDVSAEYEAFKTSFGIGGSGGTEEPDTPVEPDEPTVTLSSISATYTGGEVAVGTALTALTGITVKATYSDGSTKNVTGYTLSGTIAEGSNTITVSYDGKTTTFTVTGVAESVAPLYTLESVENGTISSRYGNGTGTLTISNGNHVKVTAGTTSEWFMDVNVSSFATHGQNVADVTDALFTIPSGANVKICAKNLQLRQPCQARIALGATDSIHSQYKFMSGSNVENKTEYIEEFTFTADGDKTVPCVSISAKEITSGTGLDFELDIEVYVNEERWI